MELCPYLVPELWGALAPFFSVPVEVFWFSVFSMSGTAKPDCGALRSIVSFLNPPIFLALKVKEWGAPCCSKRIGWVHGFLSGFALF